MNIYNLSGQVVAALHGFLQQLTYKAIKSVDRSDSDNIVLIMKEGPSANIKFLHPGVRVLTWSIDDFEGQAVEGWEEKRDNHHAFIMQNGQKVYARTHKYDKAEKWQDVYDESKFEKALDRMINKYDANNGITWDTIDYWLDEMCLKDE